MRRVVACQRDAPITHKVLLEMELYRGVARAMPATMWYFPRAGTNASISWTRDDELIVTPSKTYTAYDMVELLTDLGMDAGMCPFCRAVGVTRGTF